VLMLSEETDVKVLRRLLLKLLEFLEQAKQGPRDPEAFINEEDTRRMLRRFE
jgi:hypothetical protein